jgi:hypothetical protein
MLMLKVESVADPPGAEAFPVSVATMSIDGAPDPLIFPVEHE